MSLEVQDRFLVDPVTGFVGRVEDTSQYTVILEPKILQDEVWPIDIFIARNPDFVCVACKGADEVAVVARGLQDRTIAFDFCTLLLDPDVREETKKRIAFELEELFADGEIFAHVADILFAAPLHHSAIVSVVDAEWLGTKIRDLLKVLVDSQTRIRDLFAIWTGMKSDPLVQSVGYDVLTGRLIRKSFFRTLINSGETQADVDQRRGSLAVELREFCDPRILSKVISAYKITLAPGVRKQRATVLEDGVDEPESYLQTRRLPKPSPHQRFLQTEREVKAISSLYAEGKDSQAENFLSELLARQSEGHPEFVVKSLCNIASRTSTSGRRDVSFRLLQKALEQRQGLDAVLFLQIGNELRNLAEFDKALECYRKAKLLDDGSKVAGIRDEIIRTSVARGDYAVALTQYKEIPASEILPSTLTSLGTLYRKMGRLHFAREAYRKALIACDNWNYVAEAGVAEATKQAGNPYRSIAQYQAIFSRYKDALDHASKRVFLLALCQLFRLTEQYSEAISCLERLLEEAPLDQDANFQLAKVYFLVGDTHRAASCMQLARIPNITGLASEIFKYAMARIGPSGLIQNAANIVTFEPLDTYLPDERGLAGCRNAVAAIAEERYSDAITAVKEVEFVDKIHEDFANVLVFHANRRIFRDYDVRGDQSICRILKRGFKPLRQTAQLIASNRFDVAVDREIKLCISVA